MLEASGRTIQEMRRFWGCGGGDSGMCAWEAGMGGCWSGFSFPTQAPSYLIRVLCCVDNDENDEHGCYETGTDGTAGGISNDVGGARDGSVGDVFGDGGNDQGVMRLQISIAGHGPSALLMSLFASS